MKELNAAELKELENKLNKEYEWIWKISIKKAYKDDINTGDLSFVENIMNIVEPLDIDTPIVVAKSYPNKYIIVDWYHRVKSWLLSWKLLFKSVVLENYNINRVNDNLFEFLSCKVWKTITFIDEYIIKVWDKLYQILPNEWCWWCSNWWSSIEILEWYINKKMVVKDIKQDYIDDDVYSLYINWNKVAEVDTGRWNGYYGWDFEIAQIL